MGTSQRRQPLVDSQRGLSLRLLRGMIVDRKGNLPELEVRGINVTEKMGLFLLDQFFEDADIMGLRNLDSKHIIFFVTENKAVEQEICGHHLLERVIDTCLTTVFWPIHLDDDRFGRCVIASTSIFL
jgi:hypothetical protein